MAVIGQNAERLHAGGGGSAEIKAFYEISPLLGLKMQLGGNTEIRYAKGYFIPAKKEKKLNWQQDSLDSEAISRNESKSRTKKARQEELLREAVELAKSTDDVIVFLGLDHEYDVGRART